jgi:hypothetical protein
VGLNSLKSLNLTNVYPNNKNNKNNNKVKSKPLELRSRVKIGQWSNKGLKFHLDTKQHVFQQPTRFSPERSTLDKINIYCIRSTNYERRQSETTELAMKTTVTLFFLLITLNYVLGIGNYNYFVYYL